MALIGILKNKAGKDFFPRTKMDAVDGLNERLGHIEVKDFTATTSTTLENSNAGRLLFTEIKGVMEQGENPNPTNPQEIKNSVVSGIKTHGKNILNATLNTEFGAYNSYVINNVKAGESFTLYLKQKMSVFDANYPDAQHQYRFHDSNDNILAKGAICKLTFDSANQTKEALQTITAPEGTSYLSLNLGTYYGSSTARIVNVECQLERGESFTGYEPYTESAITFSQPIELYGLDDVRDILTSKQIKRKYAYKRILGSNIVKVNANAEYGNSIYTDLFGKPKGKCLCTHFLSVAYEDITKYLELYRCYIDEVGLDLRLRSSVNDPNTFSDLETTKSFFDTNEVYAAYELAEETTEELPIADQIALNSLQTFDGITHIEFISEIKPTFIAKYGTTEMGGMTLESLLTARSNDLRLSAVESAVINNI